MCMSRKQAGELNCRADPLFELLLGCRADLARSHLTALEDHQRRDRLDTVFRSRPWILVNIELYDLHLTVERAGDLLERRCDHATGAAPFGPEIYHDRLGRLQHLGVESGVRNFANGHGTYLVC